MAETLDRDSLKALSTDTRQDIVKLLSKRPYTASELSKLLKKHVTTITEHLEILEKSGLIKRKDSKNKWIYYELSNKGEKIFKPTYYTWVITLSLALVIMVFVSLFQAFGGGIISGQTMAASQDMRTTIESTNVDDINVVVGDIVVQGESRYIPIEITSGKTSKVIPIEIQQDVVETGTTAMIPINLDDLRNKDIEIKILESRKRNNKEYVPIEISIKDKAEELTAPVSGAGTDSCEDSYAEKENSISIIDTAGNRRRIPIDINIEYDE
ncbi:winged helix-turn-helix domain-containing protein [Candidatus Aenigmatarchaeota archaeon]